MTDHQPYDPFLCWLHPNEGFLDDLKSPPCQRTPPSWVRSGAVRLTRQEFVAAYGTDCARDGIVFEGE